MLYLLLWNRSAFSSGIIAVILVHYLFTRRQSQGPNMQHRALLDTLVLTENGARLELLDPDTKVGIGIVN